MFQIFSVSSGSGAFTSITTGSGGFASPTTGSSTAQGLVTSALESGGTAAAAPVGAAAATAATTTGGSGGKEQTEPVDFSSSQPPPGFPSSVQPPGFPSSTSFTGRGFEACFPRGTAAAAADGLARYRPQNGKFMEESQIGGKSNNKIAFSTEMKFWGKRSSC